MNELEFRETGDEDRRAIAQLINERWGSEYIVVHNTIYIPFNLDGFVALENGVLAGAVTYMIENEECEIVSLDSLKENCGIGSKLIELVVETARKRRCNSVWLVTTNDNEKAASFYQKRGFELTEIFLDAVSDSRKIKPEIPITGANGIPIKDELKFSFKI
jgi:ribosomal protein S18 acetylase RimI-like enzyme